MKIRAADVASLMFLTGLVVQCLGLYHLGGLGLTFIVAGSELALLGIAGVFRNA